MFQVKLRRTAMSCTHAELLKKTPLLLMDLSCYSFQVFLSSGQNFKHLSYTVLLYRQFTYFSYSIILFFANLKPVSLLWAAKTLWIIGLVSRNGQSRLCLFCLTIRHSVQASLADAGAVLY